MNIQLTPQRTLKQLCAIMVLLVLGCGTWVGTPSDSEEGNNESKANSEVSLEFAGKNGVSLLASIVEVVGADGSVSGTLLIKDAQLVLREIKLKKDGETELDDTESFQGPYIVDLSNNLVNPDPANIKITDRIYREIELRLHKLDGDDVSGLSEDNPLLGNSILISGIWV